MIAFLRRLPTHAMAQRAVPRFRGSQPKQAAIICPVCGQPPGICTALRRKRHRKMAFSSPPKRYAIAI